MTEQVKGGFTSDTTHVYVPVPLTAAAHRIEELEAERDAFREWIESSVALLSYLRGMCSDEAPYPEIDAKLAKVLTVMTEIKDDE